MVDELFTDLEDEGGLITSDSESIAPARDDPMTLVAEGTELKGVFMSSCPIVVNGKVEGEVTTPTLLVGFTGSVRANVKADEIRSHGELSGKFDAEMVQLCGTITTDTVVRASVLQLKLTSLKGRMKLVFNACVQEERESEARANPTSDGTEPGAGPTP